MAWEHRYIKQWIVWNIYFKGFSDAWLDSGQKASLKMSCFVFLRKLLTSEQWYGHKSQNVTCAFNLQDSHVWSRRLRLQLQSKLVKEERFILSLVALWLCAQILCYMYANKKCLSSIATVLFHIRFLCGDRFSGAMPRLVVLKWSMLRDDFWLSTKWL